MKRKGPSPTQRSLKKLRELGYEPWVVEQTIPHTFIKRDMFNFVDILAIRPGEMLAVQATSNSGGNVSARIAKIRESPHLATLLSTGCKVEVHGWGKPTKKRKDGLRVETIT